MAEEKNARLNFVLSLIDRVTNPVAKIEQAFNRLGEQGKKSLQMAGTGLAGIWASFKGINGLLQPALDLNNALTDVSAFGVASSALDKLNNKALAFQASYGGSATAFVESTKEINKAMQGLSDSQLVNITNVSNLLAQVTKSDAAATSDYLATIYKAYSSQADAMGRTKWAEQIASQTALAVRAFKMSTPELLTAFKEAGNMASRAGTSYGAQLAVFGTMASKMDAGKVGGSVKSYYENVNKASAKLGLNFNDANGRLLSTVEIIDKLNNKFGDLSKSKNAQAIREAFGGNAAEGVMVLMRNVDKLKLNMNQLGQVHGLERLTKLASDMTDPWQQFAGAVQSLRVAFGQALIPVLAPVMSKLANIAETLQRWVKLFPNIAGLIGKVTIGILALTMTISVLTFVIGTLKAAFIAIKAVSLVLTTAFKVLRVSTILYKVAVIAVTLTINVLKRAWVALSVVGTSLNKMLKALRLVTILFNATLWGCPITWIVAGILLLIAAVAACIYYWDDLTAALGHFRDYIMDKVAGAMDWLMAKLTGINDWFTNIGGWTGILKLVIKEWLSLLLNFVNKVIEYVNKVPGINVGKLDVEDIDWLKNDAVPLTFNQIRQQGSEGLLQMVKNDQLVNQNNGKTFHIDKVEIKADKLANTKDLEYKLEMGL